jgi:hypothetical protein
MRPMFVRKGLLQLTFQQRVKLYRTRQEFLRGCARKLCFATIPAIKTVASTSSGLIVYNITHSSTHSIQQISIAGIETKI